MAHSIRINLSGNLGERHRQLNGLVLNAYQQRIPFESYTDHPEDNAIDRLYKIDLASKQRNVDYIVHTFKDDDMLYVSRALKSLWLFESEYYHIINPVFLENELFRHMRMHSVNKMRHWIQMHLRDPLRCSEFYLFYKNKDFDTAAKFLCHCSNEYILNEIPNVFQKITPKRLKLLSEKVPKVTQIYFENLKQNQTLLKYYLDNDLKFFANIKFLLKTDPDVFFYIVENFYVFEKYPLFSAGVTKHIVKNHKDKFMSKPELYAAWLLNLEALANCLNSEEIKDIVIKLAKAEFLGSWFTYKRVEPLVKRLNVEERTALKKIVFIDKAFGPTIKEWPYLIPAPPKLIVSHTALFIDKDVKPPVCISKQMKLCCARGKFGHHNNTMFDKLFEKYRFKSFQQTFVELRKQLRAESVPQRRQYMLLVLVSKTGGRTEHLTTFLELLSHYNNEPAQIRAAIIRSLVKRAFVWRLPPEQWAKLLKWGHGLGLDGRPTESTTAPKKVKRFKRGRHPMVLNENPSEATCVEGLHAVIIRNLLSNARPNHAVWSEFLNRFSPLAEYSLSSNERECIRTRLPTLILADVQSRPNVAPTRLHLLLDTLSAYHIRFDEFPNTLEAIMATANSDFESAKGLLNRLYKAQVGRKTLIRKFFVLIQTDASYVNALRHDITIFKDTKSFEEVITKKDLRHERFLRKLAIYFTEKDGLCEQYLAVLELQAATKPDKILARPIALLTGTTFKQLLNNFNSALPKTAQRQLSAALRSNAHIVRPTVNLDLLGWRKAGAKAVANRVATCRQEEVERYLTKSFSWNRTLRIALVLAKRANKEHEAYEYLASRRPGAALKAALKYFQCEGDNLDPRIWQTVKPHIPKLDQGLCHYSLTNVKSIPSVIKSEYCVLVYNACKLSSTKTAKLILYHLTNLLYEVDEQFIIEEIESFLCNDCTEKMFTNRIYEVRCCSYLYVNIIGRFLLLSTSEEQFEERFRRIGIPFFNRIESLWTTFNKGNADDEMIGLVKYDLLETFVSSLKYNKVIFDVKYSSCLTVFQKLTEWMHTFLPITKWFESYVEVHIMMIYVKSVRHCLKQSPEIFSNEYRKQHEGVYMLGNTFGIFIANEVKDLTQKYFPSVIELYEEKLVRFLLNSGYIYVKNDDSIVNFTKAILKGMISSEEMVPACKLACCVYKRFGPRCNDDGINVVLKSFKDCSSKELNFCSRVEYDVNYWMQYD